MFGGRVPSLRRFGLRLSSDRLCRGHRSRLARSVPGVR
jgi:hypothetical protein